MGHGLLASGEIFIVDDDPFICNLLSDAFGEEGYETESFLDPRDFLSAVLEREPSALLIDIKLGAISGLDLLRQLDAPHYPAPIFMMSGYGDIPTAVEAVRGGAVDFFPKPFNTARVVKRVLDAIAERAGTAPGRLSPRRSELTPRERDVLHQIAGGASNKEAGRQLGISPRTVEVHRARIMEKLGAKNAADLVRIVLSDAPPIDQAAARRLSGAKR